MEKIIEVDGCYQVCPFFRQRIDCMECNHPIWEEINSDDNKFITTANKNGEFPINCPLRRESLKTVYKLKL